VDKPRGFGSRFLISIMTSAGAILCVADHWTAGIVILAMALAIVAAFWLAVVRPGADFRATRS